MDQRNERPRVRLPIALLLAASLALAATAARAADEEEMEVGVTEAVVMRSADNPPQKKSGDAKAEAEKVVTKPSVTVQSRVAPQSCTAAQTTAVEEARRAGAIRTQVATDHARGIHPSTGDNDRREAQHYAFTLIDEDVDFDQVVEISESIRDRMSSPSLPVVCSTAQDPNCSFRDAYVVGLQQPIYLCPSFFQTSSAEQRIRGLIHESAHLVGITQQGDSESYCPVFDCQITCGGFYAADAWSHFVHCTSGRPADNP